MDACDRECTPLYPTAQVGPLATSAELNDCRSSAGIARRSTFDRSAEFTSGPRARQIDKHPDWFPRYDHRFGPNRRRRRTLEFNVFGPSQFRSERRVSCIVPAVKSDGHVRAHLDLTEERAIGAKPARRTSAELMSAELDRNPVQGGRMFRSGGNWGVASGTGVPRTCPLCTSAEAVTRHRFDPLRPLALQVSEAAGHRSDMIRGRLESCPARESIARHCDAQGERISPDRTAWGRVTYRFAMCALVLVASAAILSPAGADEDAAGLLGVLSDLFKRPQDSAVNVPKRRKTKEPSTAVVPGEASGHDESVQSSPPVPQAVVPKRREGVQPSHVLQAVQDLISEIGILRGELKVRDFPPEAELVEDRAPIYVYAKSLEALTKVVGAQRRLGVVPVARGRVAPGDCSPEALSRTGQGDFHHRMLSTTYDGVCGELDYVAKSAEPVR